MSAMEKAEVERVLLSKLQELLGVSRRDGIAIDRAPDELDEAQETSDRELALAAIERDAAIAGQIRVALQRLDADEYGVCLLCGRGIGSRRLSAVPWANLCVTCQEQVEAQQRSRDGDSGWD